MRLSVSRYVLICALTLAAPASVPADTVSTAERAAGLLIDASQKLADSETAGDRVAALTGAVRAFEEGLSALRQEIRTASLRESVLVGELSADDARLSGFLGSLMTMERAPKQLVGLHPGGPIERVRAGLILSEVTPVLEARATRLRAEMEELAALRTLQDNAAIILRRGLAEIQSARQALSEAIAAREPPSEQGATDIAAMQALVNSADTLESFASTLVTLGDGSEPAEDSFAARKGRLRLPVEGEILAGFEEPNGQGIARPGVTLAVPALSLVTAPHAATIRYAGPLLDLGLVSILEPAPGTLLILSGLSETFGRAGDIVAEGAALGLMGGEILSADQILIESAEGSGQDHPKTLYIELRQGQTPVDPEAWFSTARNTGQ